MKDRTGESLALSDSLLTSNTNKIKYLLFLLLCLAGIRLTVPAAAPSDLDPTFGTGGKLMWTVAGNPSLTGANMALQADGKIVHVGGFNDTTPRFLVARYNPDGSLDPTFNGIGWINISFGGTYEYATSVEIQPDGKIVVGGSAQKPTGGQDAAIARFNPDGSLDNSFDGDGRVTVNFPDFQSLSGYPEYLNAMKLADDGKIVFAGGALGFNLNYKKFIGRLNPDGSLDSTFDGDGRLTEVMGTGAWVDLIIQTDGSLILIGSASTGSNSSIAAKYSSTGTREWDYSRDTAPGCPLSFRGITKQADGKLVIVGRADCQVMAARINPDGSSDNSFSATSVTPNGFASSVAIQPDGKIVANVFFDDSRSDGFSVIRYNADGTLDTGFGSGGFARNGIVSIDRGSKVIIQPDGKILIGGYARPAVSSYQFGMVRYLGGTAASIKTPFDYDGDGKSDISVFRPAENKWYILLSSNLSVIQPAFGATGDIPTPSDFDGDGKTDVAVFRPSAGDWWYLSSVSGNQVNVHFGQAGDVPRPSDFDGDGKTDFVVYRPSNSVWYRLGTTGQTSVTQFGIAEDKPLVGDFDGDGKSDLAVFRPSTGDWWYASSVNGQFAAVHWGQSGDIPVPGDYDADGKTDFVVYRPSNGGWYILRTGEQNYTILSFGLAEDKPVAGDYDGDGKMDVAVWRPSTGTWYLLQTTSGFGAVQFGAAGDVPTENSFLP